jgi:hypothetical protein
VGGCGCGPGLWAWAVGLGCGPELWAWAVGLGCGRGAAGNLHRAGARPRLQRHCWCADTFHPRPPATLPPAPHPTPAPPHCLSTHPPQPPTRRPCRYALTEAVGSWAYMAPEVVQGRPYNEKVDVFSFGVIVYEVGAGGGGGARGPAWRRCAVCLGLLGWAARTRWGPACRGGPARVAGAAASLSRPAAGGAGGAAQCARACCGSAALPQSRRRRRPQVMHRKLMLIDEIKSDPKKDARAYADRCASRPPAPLVPRAPRQAQGVASQPASRAPRHSCSCPALQQAARHAAVAAPADQCLPSSARPGWPAASGLRSPSGGPPCCGRSSRRAGRRRRPLGPTSAPSWRRCRRWGRWLGEGRGGGGVGQGEMAVAGGRRGATLRLRLRLHLHPLVCARCDAMQGRPAASPSALLHPHLSPAPQTPRSRPPRRCTSWTPCTGARDAASFERQPGCLAAPRAAGAPQPQPNTGLGGS